MNIYLDVDGVLLEGDGQLARHADFFLAALVRGGNTVHWLTTRCRDGNAGPVSEVLARLVQPATAALMPLIRPTSWSASKLEAIDLGNPFLWFDDQPLQFEIDELQECGLLESWVRVDLHDDPDQLAKLPAPDGVQGPSGRPVN